MRLPSLAISLLALLPATPGVVAANGRSLKHAGKHIEEHFARRAADTSARDRPVLERDEVAAKKGHKFLTEKTKSKFSASELQFAVNGTGIPDVDFDVGESYAGSLSISSDPKEDGNLFFWFFPTSDPTPKKEILIWLNGGPGCSSFEGLIQENGPFLWQYGTYKPVQNPWSWNTLTNVVYIEQPVGTGFSTGTPTATSEEDVAQQFLGWWKNFINTFDMQGYKVYISGESYAGAYCPYIASAMLDEKDKKYFDMSGMLIYDPVITYDEVQEPIPAVQFTEYWAGLFPFNDTFRADLKKADKKCGYTDFVEEYLVYPPKGHMPTRLPGTFKNGTTTDECWNIFWNIFDAILLLNPCFDIYQVATTCPLLWDVLGFPGSLTYLPEGAEIYFDRADVKKAIHAPNMTWEQCSSDDVFVGGHDKSLPSSFTALPKVIDKTKNVIIAHGALDMVLLANGTLLGIQNMTWGGKIGFRSKPVEPFYVPYNDITNLSSLAAGGVFGTTHTERGLTYVGIDMSGHMVPQYAPSAAFRQLEFLLGRVECMDCKTPFTINPKAAQSTQKLGLGTAPQGWSSAGVPGKAVHRRSMGYPRRK
ncbi:putative serine-TYPE carboxypeptidase F precursor [Apodospora peruviana]|uniref:Carboxypeptidase n=1 Tax=Apodospora peruviana TaxID=516989 RepID=A0AAE0MCS2_9PEZI|nr:putative serine-TYPE carboxypeptidase F precursor [Apodospora peruviana]